MGNKRKRMKTLSNTTQPNYSRTIGDVALTCLIVGLGIFVYSQWETFVLSTIEWQKTLHTMLASLIGNVSENPSQYGRALVAMSFGYSVFHAVGPGHGKAVIVTYLGTNNESIRKGVFISFSAAILQSLIAIVLVNVLARLLNFQLTDVHNYGTDMALVSYVLVPLSC
ncbi:MAG: nickel/cobalt exporter [Oleiphilaceae bacterium]|jgi:ABC-type nickel/cobalt efflux system permease component RcnA